jgi:hypothetical protein
VLPEAVRDFAAISKEAPAQYPPIIPDLTGAREQCAALAELHCSPPARR